MCFNYLNDEINIIVDNLCEVLDADLKKDKALN